MLRVATRAQRRCVPALRSVRARAPPHRAAASNARRGGGTNARPPATATTVQAPVGARLIPIVNQLHNIAALADVDVGLHLPQLVVVGGQSSGKSSVIENLVGGDFLPRGAGLVTRCPLVLQLHRLDDESESEYGEFLHESNDGDSASRQFTFDEVRQEVLAETARLAGANKNISTRPIVLRLYSPRVLPLTLVDTPGVTRVPIGDQPPDIERLLEQLIEQYIVPESSIVLAVHAANQDLATSDALKLARRVDPHGKRTVGVLTKVDIMDQGSDPLSLLTGQRYPLRLGWFAVVNRSQRDIQLGKSIADALKDEERFFSDGRFRGVRSNTGTANLASRCSELLTEHIRQSLPTLKQQLRVAEEEASSEMAAYGTPLTNKKDKNAATWYVSHLITAYTNTLTSAVSGRGGGGGDVSNNNNSGGSGGGSTSSATTLRGGARLRYIFTEIYHTELDRINPLDQTSIEELRVAIRNAAGPSAALFIPEEVFSTLVKRQIELLRQPALKMLDLVVDELLSIALAIDERELSRYAVLRRRIVEVTTDLMRQYADEARAAINDLVDLELGFINTNHPRFVSGAAALGGDGSGGGGGGGNTDHGGVDQLPSRRGDRDGRGGSGGSGLLGFLGSAFSRGGASASDGKHGGSSSGSSSKPQYEFGIDKHELTARDRMQLRLTTTMVTSYFDIARSNIADMAVKAVMHKLVNRVTNNLQQEVVAALYSEKGAGGNIEQLLVESEDAVARREACGARLEALRKARQVLKEAELSMAF
eukprot:CAMPEP_0198323828 /NCGR_PEP_ID=MMETSP1450-20131203/11964_1 /TAXON_ID=753684 ORGANISM="Madagascaria erythrocladiodes, Strain CCMP3234" /NCGR_SAMPLE_ID=MMETSP1450 /ASSEMBLY_ACC=CAM_ASM_001115 /LENGTH=764 /DNA_ID=CAMNT_0044027569 /DNA_START=8 /DNA_END=2302 /DNA_ORIENTATION=+